MQADHKVCVAGDLSLTHICETEFIGLAKEGPVPSIRVVKEHWRASGAAALALNLKSLGFSVDLVGIIGQDAAGDRLTMILEEAGIDCHLYSDVDTKTLVHQRFLQAERLLLEVESTVLYRSDMAERCCAIHQSCLQGVRSLLLVDDGKGSLHVPTWITAARRLQVPVMTIPSHQPLCTYKGSHLLLTDWSQFKQLLQCDILTQQEMSPRAVAAMKHHNIGAILVLHEQGLSLMQLGRASLHVAHDALAGVLPVALAVWVAMQGPSISEQEKINKVAEALDYLSKHRLDRLNDIAVMQLMRSATAHHKIWHSEDLPKLIRWLKCKNQTLIMVQRSMEASLLQMNEIERWQQTKSAQDCLLIALPKQEEALAKTFATFSFVDVILLCDEKSMASLSERLSPVMILTDHDHAH